MKTSLSFFCFALVLFNGSGAQLTLPQLQPLTFPQVPLVSFQPQLQSGQIYPIPNTTSPFCLLGSTPVCGANNQTYPNPCVLILLQIDKKSDGWCPEPVVTTTITTISYKTPNNGYLTALQNADSSQPCACNSAYNPVCGKNGVTYASRCRLECANVLLNRMGPCGYFNWSESPHFNCPCPYEFSPVCGRDNTTYENECALRCGHQSLLYKGSCINPCNCSNTYKPVCAKNSKTYRNICLMKCDKQTIFKQGMCPDRRPRRCAYCEGLIRPVCAINGLTYDNQCYIKCAGVSVYAQGICPDDSAYEHSQKPDSLLSCDTCKKVVLPVCGADGRTYRNACAARCRNQKIIYRGKCLHERKKDSELDKCGCPKIIRPVCGVDGRTYQSKCFADCFSIRVLGASGCQPYNPSYCHHLCRNYRGAQVCGKNFITYQNECVMSGCMRVPKLRNGACDALNSANHPGKFSFDLLKKGTVSMSNMGQAQPLPVVARPPSPKAPIYPHNLGQSAPQSPQVAKPSHVPSPRPSTGQMVYPASGSPVDIQTVDLTNKNSVIKIYKLLFPNGRALSKDVTKYKSILEGLLYNRFKVDPRTLF